MALIPCFVENDRTSSVSNMNHCKIYNELKNKIERNKVFKDSKRDFFQVVANYVSEVKKMVSSKHLVRKETKKRKES